MQRETSIDRLAPDLGGRVLFVAIGFGILADALLRVQPWGLNLCLTVLVGVAAAALTAHWAQVRLEGEGRWLALAMLFFALALVWRDSPTLTVANSIALVVATTLTALTARVGQVRLAGVTQYLVGIGYMLGYANMGLLPVLRFDIGWRRLSHHWWSGPALAAGRGVLVAVPPLVIFGSLFAAADAQFERLVTDLFAIDTGDLVVRMVLIAAYAWLLGGLVREMLLAPERPREWAQPPSRLTIGTIELTVVLGLVDLLFLSFVALQLPYLFGGQSQIDAIGHSAYARRGFFELVWVAGLSLPFLLVLHWLIRGERPLALRLYRILALTMVGLLVVVMASAMQRMQLYVVFHGLTELRVQASAFMAWLAVVLVWFALTVLRDQRRRFAFGALIAGFATIAALNVMNPDALVVRTNAAYGNLIADDPRDLRPLASLSADATPAIVEALPSLSEADRRGIEERLHRRWSGSGSGEGDWRTFNWSRAQAQAAVGSLSR